MRQAELAHALESYVKQQPRGASPVPPQQDGSAARTTPRPDGEAAGAVSAGSGHKRECSGGAARDAEGEMKRSRSINSELQDLRVEGSPNGSPPG